MSDPMLTLTAIPHDPTNDDPGTCPTCNEPWPCAERKRQRPVVQECVGLALLAGYERDDTAHGGGYCDMRFVRPAHGWTFVFGYGGLAPFARLLGNGGEVLASTDALTFDWFAGALSGELR